MNRTGWGLALFTALVAVLVLGEIPRDPIEAHRYADGVLLPRFTAAVNDFVYLHPKDPPEKPWAHCETFDAADAARWRLVRETFRNLDKAYRRAYDAR